MDKNKKYKLDPVKMTPEQRDKLEAWEHNKKQLLALDDIADITQDISSTIDAWKKDGSKSTDKVGALLVSVKESLEALVKKEDPEAPDYAKPVVKAVEGLKKALETAIKSIDVKPDVNVQAPNVSTTVDLSKLEKIIKTDIPKAFKDSIALIPETEIPEADYTPLTELMTQISEKLDSIDTGVRMKPQMPVYATNSSNQLIVDTDSAGGTLVPGTDFDYIDGQQTSSSVDTYVYKTGGSSGTTVRTVTLTYTDANKTDIDKIEYA